MLLQLLSFFGINNNDLKLTILHQNIARLINKSDLLAINLEELAEETIYIDVICVLEHFIKFGDEDELNITNYLFAAFCS